MASASTRSGPLSVASTSSAWTESALRVLPPQTVGLLGHVLEDTSDQLRLDASAPYGQRSFDRRSQLLGSEPRNQKLAVVDGLRERGPFGALAETFGAQCNCHMNASACMSGRR